MPSKLTYIGLGSNLGDRHAHLQFAIDKLGALPGLDLSAVSSLYQSAAHVLDGSSDQPNYLNAVLACSTTLTPEELLQQALSIETARGRERHESKWAARTLDIDLLHMPNPARITDAPILPHPRLAERSFVLIPLAEIAPNLHIPAPYEASVRYLLEHCADSSAITRINLSLRIPKLG